MSWTHNEHNCKLGKIYLIWFSLVDDASAQVQDTILEPAELTSQLQLLKRAATTSINLNCCHYRVPHSYTSCSLPIIPEWHGNLKLAVKVERALARVGVLARNFTATS